MEGGVEGAEVQLADKVFITGHNREEYTTLLVFCIFIRQPQHREMHTGDTGGERRLGLKSGRRICEKAGTAGLPESNGDRMVKTFGRDIFFSKND
jgi:hypothetical protein